jgi:hypothetical protein
MSGHVAAAEIAILAADIGETAAGETVAREKHFMAFPLNQETVVVNRLAGKIKRG